VAIDFHRQAVEALNREGLAVKTPNGFEIQSPYLAIANRQATIIARLAAEFGFTPSSRTRVAIEKAPEADGSTPSLQEFLASKPLPPEVH
jgi:P27 family predicted phage terminase small subunit